MTVIRPNSISGITSLTAHRGSIDFYAHDGSAATFNNINSNVTSGVSTFASLNITGDLDVGGALTYEDVTNVDSIGVVTARNGIDVTGGTVTITTGANSASPAGSGDNLVIKDSNGCGLSILSGNGNSQNIYLGSVSDNDCVRLEGFYNSGSPYFNIYTANSERLRITSAGYVGINDNSPDTQLSVNSGVTNVVAKFASTDQYAWIQFRDNSTTDTAVMVGADGDNLLLRSGSNERVRVTSGGTVKFATNNSTTDYLEWGGNPRLMLQAPAGLNGLRVYGTTTPLEVGGSASTRKISMGGNPNYDLSISGSYSLSSGGHDSSPKVFLNATRHNGSSTVTSFQTSIQAVSASNTASDGYLGLGASATPDDLVIRPSGNIGINDTAPSEKLNVGGNIMLEGSDQYMYLTNVGTGNAGIYVRGRDATNELRSHSTGIFTWEVTGSEKMRLTSGGEITNGNLVINGFANQNTPGGYSQYQSDNHANTLFGQNLKLGASSGSGNHQIEIINQHSTIGGAGMYIGGNGSNQQNAINFYAEAANQTPGTNVTSNRRAQVNSSSFFTWVEPRNQSSNAQSYIRTFGFTFNLQDGETETLFYNPDGYRRIYYEIYIQSGHGSNGYGYILANVSRYGMLVHDEDWHVSHTSYSFSGSVGGNVNRNGIKFTRSGYSNTNITYYVIVKCWSPAGGTPYGNSGLTDPSYRYFSQGY